ncbi:MAG: hypothetical protein ACJ8CN_06665, partial [Gemmatimonadales bacterium]
MIQSKFGQRLVGALMLVLSGGFTARTWYAALEEGYYNPKAAAIFPALLVFGLGLLLFPIDVERLKAEHGVEKVESLDQVPPAWWGVLIAALAA